MNIKPMFPSCTVPVVFADLSGAKEAGSYDPVTDKITLCTSLTRGIPICASIVYAHEMFHSTGHKSRSLRRWRLMKNFGAKAYNVEECIVEIAILVMLKKQGILNQYSRILPEEGLKKYYINDIYIPWKEVVSTVNYYKADDIDFTPQLAEIREYLTSVFKLDIRDYYEGTRDTSN